MSLYVVCPREHEWEVSDQSLASPTDCSPRCPICGEAGTLAESRLDRQGTDSTPARESASLGISNRARDETVSLLDDSGRDSTGPSNIPTSPHTSADHAHSDRPSIPGYEIHREVGSGGMGIVYEAYDVSLKRTVALKMVLGGFLAGKDKMRRFRLEAQAMAQLDHPNIVPVFADGEYQGQPYFTMKFMPCGSLDGHLRRFGTDLRAAAGFMEKVARAVQYLHERNIVHRDLKPLNILLDEKGEPHVTDFGLAKFLDGSLDATQTQRGAIMGSRHYMAPEQAAGATDQICPGTDVWALGVMLYQLLTGQRPFEPKSEEDLSRRIKNTEPARPCSIQPLVDQDLEAIVLHCLEKDPLRRYVKAADLADDLDRWLCGEPIVARPVTAGRRRLSRRKLILASAGMVVLGLGLALSYPAWNALLAVKQKESPPEPSISLIDDKGPPEQFLWILGAKVSEAKTAETDGFYTVRSKELGLLELLPSVPWDRFRLQAEVRQDGGGADTRVGLYYGYVKSQSNQGEYHGLFDLAFVDSGIGVGEGDLRFLGVPVLSPFNTMQTPCTTPYTFKTDRQALASERWHKVAIQVTPEEVQVFLDEACMGSLPTSELQISGALTFRDTPGINWIPNSRGGLGLYVLYGQASFRNVFVQRLK